MKWEAEYKPGSNFDRAHWRIVAEGMTAEGFRNVIATTVRHVDEKKHARLIAAAPDLLAALDALLLWDDGNLPGDMIDQARAAIAKARGQ